MEADETDKALESYDELEYQTKCLIGIKNANT